MKTIFNSMNLLIALILASLLIGCNSSGEAIDLSEQLALENAMNKWNNERTDYYTVRYQRLCECLDDISSAKKVSVINNSVLAVVDLATNEHSVAAIRNDIKTVEELFSLIQQAINLNISILVEYDAELGYPISTRIDLDAIAVDSGLTILLSELDFQETYNALDDVEWKLVSFSTIAGPQEPIANSRITLSFVSNGSGNFTSGFAGCNNYTGEYYLTDTSDILGISVLSSTSSMCVQPENIMEQEGSYLSGLESTQTFGFEQNNLLLIIGADYQLQFEMQD